jgi:phenylpyruvate tautomerase PptA (4-oxalocrotonate tautomerase family)
MPTYRCTAPAGLLDAAKRAAIAKEITRIHNRVTCSHVVPAKAGTHNQRLW